MSIPLFEFLPVEQRIRKNQTLYYQNLAKADDACDCTGFIAFILEQIDESLRRLLGDTWSFTITASDRLEFARSFFKNQAFSRKDYQVHLKNISSATASRDLRQGVVGGLLQKTGDKRTARYVFK